MTSGTILVGQNARYLMSGGYEIEHGEIADTLKQGGITGLAEGTLKSHLFRSRKRLQEWLAPGMGVAA